MLWLVVLVRLCVFYLQAWVRCWSSLYISYVCVFVEVKIPSLSPPPSSCLSTSLQSHSPPSPCQSPCQCPIRTQRRRQPSSSVTTPAAPWSPPPPSSPPPSQTPASCRHSNQLCRGTPCRQGYHSDQPAQVRHTAGLRWWELFLYDAAWWWLCRSMVCGIFIPINSALRTVYVRFSICCPKREFCISESSNSSLRLIK